MPCVISDLFSGVAWSQKVYSELQIKKNCSQKRTCLFQYYAVKPAVLYYVSQSCNHFNPSDMQLHDLSQKYQHCTPLLEELHQPPSEQQINYKSAFFDTENQQCGMPLAICLNRSLEIPLPAGPLSQTVHRLLNISWRALSHSVPLTFRLDFSSYVHHGKTD